jgi:hypothetical protein
MCSLGTTMWRLARKCSHRSARRQGSPPGTYDGDPTSSCCRSERRPRLSPPIRAQAKPSTDLGGARTRRERAQRAQAGNDALRTFTRLTLSARRAREHAPSMRGGGHHHDNCRYVQTTRQPLEGDVVDADKEFSELCAYEGNRAHELHHPVLRERRVRRGRPPSRPTRDTACGGRLNDITRTRGGVTWVRAGGGVRLRPGFVRYPCSKSDCARVLSVSDG